MIVSCGISSVVERHPSKLDVTGSNPVFRFPFWGLIPIDRASERARLLIGDW